jgi:D-3-phosphoglycerate dehydrogenase / 2-oxoglutarate reductase
MTILLLETIHPEAHALLAEHDEVVLAPSPNESQLAQSGIVAVLTRGRGRVTKGLLEHLPDVRVVARCGVGLDNIDIEAAHGRGIRVVYAPGSTTETLAEHTLMLMLAAARQLRMLSDNVYAGRWSVRNQYGGLELRGKTLGILGLGAIGQRVAELASAFQMRVIYWNRTPVTTALQAVSFAELLATADILSLHTALTPTTRHIIGAAELAQCKPGALLINTARGGLIDQVALYAALQSGQIGYFAADVLDPEPPTVGEALLQHEHTLITPHVAAITDLTYRAVCVSTAQNVLAILRGEEPQAESIYQQ